MSTQNNVCGISQESQVTSQVSYSKNLEGRLHEVVDHLEAKLINVTRPAIDLDKSAAKPEKELNSSLVPLACELAGINTDIEAYIDRLRSLLDRTEL